MRYIIVLILLIGSVAHFGLTLDDLDRGNYIAENYVGSIQDQATEVVPINIIPTPGFAGWNIPED